MGSHFAGPELEHTGRDSTETAKNVWITFIVVAVMLAMACAYNCVAAGQEKAREQAAAEREGERARAGAPEVRPDAPAEVDKSRLETRMVQAWNVDASLFTEESYAQMRAMIDEGGIAATVYNDPNATQAQVDVAASKLAGAMGALVEVPKEPPATIGQSNALRAAHGYLGFTSFSYSGLVDQLVYEGFSYEDATWAVDRCGADWNAQAAETARDYLAYAPFSRQGLIDQLVYEGFSYEQAEYGVAAVGY